MANLSSFTSTSNIVYGSVKKTTTLSYPSTNSTTISTPGKLIGIGYAFTNSYNTYYITIGLTIDGVTRSFNFPGNLSQPYGLEMPYMFGGKNFIYLNNLKYSSFTLSNGGGTAVAAHAYYMEKI